MRRLRSNEMQPMRRGWGVDLHQVWRIRVGVTPLPTSLPPEPGLRPCGASPGCGFLSGISGESRTCPSMSGSPMTSDPRSQAKRSGCPGTCNRRQATYGPRRQGTWPTPKRPRCCRAWGSTACSASSARTCRNTTTAPSWPWRPWCPCSTAMIPGSASPARRRAWRGRPSPDPINPYLSQASGGFHGQASRTLCRQGQVGLRHR